MCVFRNIKNREGISFPSDMKKKSEEYLKSHFIVLLTGVAHHIITPRGRAGSSAKCTKPLLKRRESLLQFEYLIWRGFSQS